MMKRGKINFVDTKLQTNNYYDIEQETDYYAIRDNALNKLKLYATNNNSDVDTDRYLQTYKGDTITCYTKYLYAIKPFYHKNEKIPLKVNVIKSSFSYSPWVIVIDIDNKKCFYSLDGNTFVDENVVNHFTKPTIEWSKIDKNTKLKCGTRITGIPKAIKKYILNPKSKFNPKYYVDNECKLHDIKKESKIAEKILWNNFVKDVKKIQEEKKQKDFNNLFSRTRNNRHFNY